MNNASPNPAVETKTNKIPPAGDPPKETAEQKKVPPKQLTKEELKVLKDKEKSDKKAQKDKEKAEKAVKKDAPTPTKPAAAGKKPVNVFDLENVKLLVRPVMKKGDKESKVIGYACRPLDWGQWKLGEKGKANELGTVMLINKDNGKRASMSFEKFEKDFDWQANIHINCRGGQCPK